MLDTRGRVLAIVVIGMLGLTACGGDDAPTSTPTETGGEPSAPSTSTDEPEEPDHACTPGVAAMLPEGFDPETCWTADYATNPVFAGDTVFALVTDPMAAAPTDGTEPTPSLVAYEADSGKQIWASEPMPGPVSDMAAAEVDGKPGVGILLTETDEGDALTESSESWGYYAWPGDVDEDTPTEAPVHITAPINPDITGSTTVVWTDQGVLAGNQLLKPGATKFVEVTVDTEPVVIGDYDLDETFVSVSGDTFLSFATGVAYTEGGSEDGDTYNGWVARGADGAQTWDNLKGTPNTDDSLFGEGPSQMPLVIGDYALTVIPTDEDYTDYTLAWFDAATGEPATPKPADLTGAQPIGGAAAVMTNNVAALLTPNAKYLFLYWSTLALVIDVEAGTVTRVSSDFEITGTAIDDTTVYGRTENGAITIDLATATATAEKEGTEAIQVLNDGRGAFTASDGTGSGIEYLVVAERKG